MVNSPGPGRVTSTWAPGITGIYGWILTRCCCVRPGCASRPLAGRAAAGALDRRGMRAQPGEISRPRSPTPARCCPRRRVWWRSRGPTRSPESGHRGPSPTCPSRRRRRGVRPAAEVEGVPLRGAHERVRAYVERRRGRRPCPWVLPRDRLPHHGHGPLKIAIRQGRPSVSRSGFRSHSYRGGPSICGSGTPIRVTQARLPRHHRC